MLTYEDEQKEKFKKLDIFLENCEKLIKEIEQKRKKEENVKQSLNINAPQQSQQFQNHSLYNSLKDSDFHKFPLILLSETQEYDENHSYQKLMDLFIEENQTIQNLSFNSNSINEYLILQLYTAFSLKARKLYLNSFEDVKENEKSRISLITLNDLQYNKNEPLNGKILNFFNHNILRVEDIYQSSEVRDLNFEREKYNDKILQMEKDIPIIEGSENSKWKAEISTKFDLENDDEKVIQGQSISLKAKYRNFEEVNEKFQKKKIENIKKIIDMDEKELEGMNFVQVEDLMRKKYEKGDEKIFNFDDSNSNDEDDDNESIAEIRDRYPDEDSYENSSNSFNNQDDNKSKRNSKDDYCLQKDYGKIKKNFGFVDDSFDNN